jgi:protease YdgD
MMRRLSGLMGICLGLLSVSMPGMAQISAEERPLSAAEQSQWGAIGQITYGGAPGGAICTGTLVAADLVLTAGHCVAVDGVAMQAGDIQFAAGWRDGGSIAVRHGKAVILAQPTAGQPREMSQDVALLVLDAPIGGNVLGALPLSRQDLFAQSYSFIGYRRDAPRVAVRNDACELVATQPGVLQLGCTVVSGNSGAPVLMYRRGTWQVAAVMVARGGDAQSFAVIPGDDLRARIAAD